MTSVVLVLALVGISLVAYDFLTRDSGTGPGPSGDPNPVTGAALPTVATGTVHGSSIDASGGQVAVTDTADPAAGVTVTVPPGAVSGPVNVSVQAAAVDGLTAGDLLTHSQPVLLALTEEAQARSSEQLHPYLAMMYALDTAELVGPTLQLEPAGTTFAAPVEVTIPLSTLGGDPSDLMFVLTDEDGRSEVVTDAMIDGDVVRLRVSHFSALSGIKNFVVDVVTWVYDTGRKVVRNSPDLIQYLANSGPVAEAAATLRPDQEWVTEFGRGAACAGLTAQPVSATIDNIPGLWDLLKWFGWHSADDPRVQTGKESALAQLIEQRAADVKAGTAPPLTPGDLFQRAMELTNGDTFQALLTAHNTLYDQRRRIDGAGGRPGVLRDGLARIRPTGEDDAGAWYHMFGTATFSFANEVASDNRSRFWLFGGSSDPEFVSTMEEAIFASDGGDVSGDPKEYAIDLQGARLGRALHAQLPGQSRGQLEQAFQANPNDCDGAPGQVAASPSSAPTASGYYAVRVSGSRIFSVRPASAVDNNELAWCHFRHGGRDCDTLAPLDKLAGPTTIEEATRHICSQFVAGTFSAPPLAAGWHAAIGETYYTVDDWGSLDIGLCRTIVNGG